MNENTKLRILLVDDHAVVRAGYRFLLENNDDISVVAEAETGEAALPLYEEYRPDIVVLDINMPGMGGLETIRRLKTQDSEANILVFSMHENPAYVEQCLQSGVKGYISKNSSPEVLVTAIRRLSTGQTYIDNEIAQHMVVQQTRQQGSLFGELSSREFQILCLYAEARSHEDIAAELSLSTKTIANYLTQIKDKLEVSSTAELVRLAISNDLVKI